MPRPICDMHVHTRFSEDSRESLEAYCLAAVEKGVGTLCFTEHMDYNPYDNGYKFYDADAFFEEFNRVKDIYRGKINLLCGLEFGEPHIYKEEFTEYLKYPYDFIMGTLHWWYKDMFPSQMVKAGVPAEDCYEHYWDEMLKMARAGGFDCLAHVDFPKRYYGKLIIDEPKVEAIYNALVGNGICIEINTSSIRKGLDETMPGNSILGIYKACGGRYVTVGSDAHSAADLAAGADAARGLIARFGFEEVIFEGRRMRIIN